MSKREVFAFKKIIHDDYDLHRISKVALPEDGWPDWLDSSNEFEHGLFVGWMNRADLAAERERENDALKDQLQDERQLLVIVANALGVEDEPQQTWADRLMTAAKYANSNRSE